MQTGEAMAIGMSLAMPVPMPAGSGIATIYPSPHLADAYAIELPQGASRDPEVLARYIFSHQPAWVGVLMGMRDRIVACFGLKTGKQLSALATGERAQGRVGIFKIYSKTDKEILLGEDDRHLDFRVSVLCASSPTQASAQLTVATVVHCHNLLGRSYLLLISPFHRMVVKAGLKRAARLGWPRAATGAA